MIRESIFLAITTRISDQFHRRDMRKVLREEDADSTRSCIEIEKCPSFVLYGIDHSCVELFCCEGIYLKK
jgi:hypothetical protein